MVYANSSAKIRNKTGKGPSHAARREHEVPGVIYGRNMDNMMVEFAEMEMNDIISKYGEHAVVEVDVEGKKVKSMIKEVQRNPVNRNIIHIDMKVINGNENVHAEIPVSIKGEERINAMGGIVQKQLSFITVDTTPDKLPKYFVADVSNLKIGDNLTIADMELSADMTVADNLNSIVLTIIKGKDEKNLNKDTEIEK